MLPSSVVIRQSEAAQVDAGRDPPSDPIEGTHRGAMDDQLFWIQLDFSSSFLQLTAIHLPIICRFSENADVLKDGSRSYARGWDGMSLRESHFYRGDLCEFVNVSLIEMK
jgi:hypothetical protein